MTKFTDAESKRVIGLVPPMEEDLGATGSFCEYGGITLQIDPFTTQQAIDKAIGKQWVPVPGVGDAAKFFNDKNRWANLIVWTGAHHFTVQIGVPTGATGESMMPSTIGVANAIIPKLK